MLSVENFNSHARVGRDVSATLDFSDIIYFNSHARVGRDLHGLTARLRIEHFNSHARVGRDMIMYRIQQLENISTHTPAWGVTYPLGYEKRNRGYFNSHARVGRDCCLVRNSNAACNISTHTPAWGVTQMFC